MVKVGDKVRVTTDRFGPKCPEGAVFRVSLVAGDPTIHACDERGVEWSLWHGDYEPIPADKPDPRDDPSNPDKLPLFRMSGRAALLIMRTDPSGRDFWEEYKEEWLPCVANSVDGFDVYRLRPRTVRIEYDCDKDGRPIMETGREVG